MACANVFRLHCVHVDQTLSSIVHCTLCYSILTVLDLTIDVEAIL